MVKKESLICILTFHNRIAAQKNIREVLKAPLMVSSLGKVTGQGDVREAATRSVLQKKVFLEISQKNTGKHLFQSLRPAFLLKKRLWQRCFPDNFAKLLRTPLLQNTSRLLLLKVADVFL